MYFFILLFIYLYFCLSRSVRGNMFAYIKLKGWDTDLKWSCNFLEWGELYHTNIQLQKGFIIIKLFSSNSIIIFILTESVWVAL